MRKVSETKYEEFHQLVEEFSGEMSIRNICFQEKMSYQGYLSWRKSHGLSRRRGEPAPSGLVEVEVVEPQSPVQSSKALNVHIEFENGLCLHRPEMDVDSLIRFLTQIRPVLCLS